jgi:predicted dinucleotide-binding enzyme
VSAPRTIAVVGAGVVGGNLVRRLVELGHHVLIGARDPASEATVALAASVPGVSIVGLGQAGRDADVVILAVPAPSVVDAALAVLADRTDAVPLILVDATNDVAGTDRSPYERIVDAVGTVPGVSVVKAFNTVGAEAILHPSVDGRPLFLPIAGPLTRPRRFGWWRRRSASRRSSSAAATPSRTSRRTPGSGSISRSGAGSGATSGSPSRGGPHRERRGRDHGGAPQRATRPA